MNKRVIFILVIVLAYSAGLPVHAQPPPLPAPQETAAPFDHESLLLLFPAIIFAVYKLTRTTRTVKLLKT